MRTKLTISILLVSVLGIFTWLNLAKDDFRSSKAKRSVNSFKACSSADFLLTSFDSTRQVAPTIPGLGKHHFKISSKNDRAQFFFDQGLNLAFAFNHAESHRSFLEASRLDDSAAMAFWGQAYVLGPNINDQVPDDERKEKAYMAVQKAKELSDSSSQLEQDLIEALTHRYSKDSVAEISSLNLAYMKAMETVVASYPDNPDVLTLYAAAIMNTTPWNYWQEDGSPQPNIEKAKNALEKALNLNADHAGAHHYYIHMVELPKPDLAVPSAEKLAQLMPGAGHMVHMPGHIYMRVGRYADAVKANQDAILVDEEYISQCYAQGIYPLGYYPHNIHFLWSAASMMGNESLAIDAGRKTAEKVSYGALLENRYFQNFAATPILAYLRFGKWNEVLSQPDPGESLPYLQMIRSYARGVAFTRKNNSKEAQEELELLKTWVAHEDFGSIAKVAYHVTAGEVYASTGNKEKATEHFEKAIAYEDELPYDEPAVWYIPVRQSYGAFLVETGEFSKAEKIYLEDLSYYRENGWSLKGLELSLAGQGKVSEAKEVSKRFEKAWKDADIELTSSVK